MVAALSPSRASDFKQCPLLYRFRVVDRLPEPPSAAAVRGTLVHAVLERLFDLPAEERTPENAVSLLPGQWADLLERDPELASLAAAPDADTGDPASSASVAASDATGLDAWLGQADSLVRRWFTLEDPTRLEPAEREAYVEADVDGLTLRGYVDRLDVAPDGRMRVVDYKTGRSPSEMFEGRALFQMKFYALVLWRSRGALPTLLQLVYLGNGEIVRYTPQERELVLFERKLRALWDAIARAARTGDWRPNPGRLCSWCHHRALCPAFGGTPPALPPDAELRALDPRHTGLVEVTDAGG